MTALSDRPALLPEEHSERPERRWPRWLLAAGVPTAVTALHSGFYRNWIVDDAGLSFAYARALTSGAGAVLQPGAEPVEGYSNPAWVAILAVGRTLRLFDHGAWFGMPDIVAFPKLVALFCCFGIFAAMYAIADAVTARPVPITILAGSLTAMVPSFVIWTSSGLENGLFALTVMASGVVLVRGAVAGRLTSRSTAVAAGALAALAALTRPDGVVYLLALPIALALSTRRAGARDAIRAALTSLLAFAVPFGSYLVWRIVTFGDVLPNPARAKAQGLPTLADLNRPGTLVTYVGWLLVCVGVAVVVVALTRRTPTRTALAMLLVPLGLALLAFAVLERDWMEQFRFATAVWPLAALATVLAAAAIIPGSALRTRVLAAVLAVAAACSSMAGLWSSEQVFRAYPTVSMCIVAQNTGYLYNGYADILGIREGSLLAVDGGGTSLTTRLRYVDLSGLGNRDIADYWARRDMRGLRNYVFEDVRPTFIKMFSGWYERELLGLARDPRMARDYVLMFAGEPGSADWVRRDAVGDRSKLAAARVWGQRSWDLVESRYPRSEAQKWWCPERLAPTPFSDGRPAPSPLTRASTEEMR